MRLRRAAVGVLHGAIAGGVSFAAVLAALALLPRVQAPPREVFGFVFLSGAVQGAVVGLLAALWPRWCTWVAGPLVYAALPLAVWLGLTDAPARSNTDGLLIYLAAGIATCAWIARVTRARTPQARAA